MKPTTRRTAIKGLSAATALAGVVPVASAHADEAAKSPHSDAWKSTHDRIWLGGEYWANPMENWRIIDGAAECTSTAGGRNVHWITRQIESPQLGFEISVEGQRVEMLNRDGGFGFRIGVRSDLDEYRSNSFASGGVTAGLRAGKLFINKSTADYKIDVSAHVVQLSLKAEADGEKIRLTLKATSDGEESNSVSAVVPAENLVGNICIVNNFDAKPQRGQGSRYRFTNWQTSGAAVAVNSDHRFGPILWSMYTLSDSRSEEGFVLKISALTGPLGAKDNNTVQLFVKREAGWVDHGAAILDPDAWTATFRIPNWNEKSEAAYKLVYHQKHRDGSETPDEWTGAIQPNPTGRPLRMAALTCQNHYGFPYEPVANNVKNLTPDLVYFSGDQLYESHGGFGLIREPAESAILNYLRKFYMFGWAFRDVMRSAPTVCIPDDHDVFQGNIWGEGGARMKDLEKGASSKGGYREPARMVNVVHRTNAAHHPDYFDPTPVKQGISVYYGDMVYGDVSFAILGDRQFKSGPERVETGSGRADHVMDRNFDTQALDKPGLVLLGDRQEKFLTHWSRDWRGHTMKVLLSQTVFAGVATHHGRQNGYLKADLDSGGWPQAARDRAIAILHDAKPLHINGDQHLTSLAQYGTQKQRDGCWSFCTPAISAGYPRWWRPDEIGMPHRNRPKHGLPNTGEFLDGFGNKVYVYSVGNPEAGSKKNRYELAHQKGSGFGFVTIDTQAKTYFIEAFRFLVDLNIDNQNAQFPGWPVTIHQQENAGDNLLT